MEMDICMVMHMLTGTNGNDNQITTAVVSNEVSGILNHTLGEGRAVDFGMNKKLKTIVAGVSR